MKSEEENIEIRSDDVQEVIGRTPSWMVRYGITIITISIVVFLIGSYFFKYPDIITSNEFVIITENPPVSIIARTDGKIQDLSIADEQQVFTGQVLAMIENPANIKQFNHLKKLFEPFRYNKSLLLDSLHNFDFRTSFQLGDVQEVFLEFSSNLNEINYFIELNYYPRKIESVKEEIKQHRVYYNRLYRQRNLLEEEFSLSNKQFKRDSTLFAKQLISEVEYENSRSLVIQKRYDFEGARTKLSDSKIRISELEQEILDLQLNFANNKKQLELNLIESFDKLLAEIAAFEQKYILTTPIDGFVSFHKIWSNNQFLRQNETVFTVVPEKETKIIGKLELPVKKSGKVKIGQRVNIKLDNYPHLEYGMVEGRIEKISRVPEDNQYSLEVSFPNGLTTNYNRKLPFNQKMQGQAEIVTESMRLLTRIINPFKSAVKEHTE